MTHRMNPADPLFLTTQWTHVLAARGDDATAREALRDLSAAYYEPVVAFLQRGGAPADEARDLAHGFFAELLSRDALAGVDRERGRFRSYLLGALKHFLSHERERRARLKRGAGQTPLPLEFSTHDTAPGERERPLLDERALPPDREFDRQWALQILRRSLTALERESRAEERAADFTRLKPFLTGDATHGGLAALAHATGEAEATLRSRLHRWRQRFRVLVRREVATTLSSRADLDDEMASLFAALRGDRGL